MAEAFQKWVTAYGGTLKVAAALKVTPTAVRHWVNRKGNPNVKTLIEIIRISNGELSYSQIIESTRPKERG